MRLRSRQGHHSRQRRHAPPRHPAHCHPERTPSSPNHRTSRSDDTDPGETNPRRPTLQATPNRCPLGADSIYTWMGGRLTGGPPPAAVDAGETVPRPGDPTLPPLHPVHRACVPATGLGRRRIPEGHRGSHPPLEQWHRSRSRAHVWPDRAAPSPDQQRPRRCVRRSPPTLARRLPTSPRRPARAPNPRDPSPSTRLAGLVRWRRVLRLLQSARAGHGRTTPQASGVVRLLHRRRHVLRLVSLPVPLRLAGLLRRLARRLSGTGSSVRRSRRTVSHPVACRRSGQPFPPRFCPQ